MASQEKLEMLRAKIERVIKAGDAPRADFLGVIAAHNGSIMEDSISFSFREFKEKYGNEKFEEILKDFKEEGIVVEKYGLRFAVLDERGEFDYKASEKLARFTGKLIFESNPRIKQVIDEILKEPEGSELLKFIAREKGVNIFDGQEPEIKEMVGKRAYELITDKLVKNNILIRYAWSSKKHSYSGYKLLPFVDEYLKSSLGMVELTDSEKLALGYIGSFNEIFSGPSYWYIWFNYPTEYEHRTLDACSLHKKFLASLIDETEENTQKIIEELKKKKLIIETDLGYTRGGSHRGIILKLSESGQRICSQVKEETKTKIENEVKETFSDKESLATYYLFCKERVPFKLLSLTYKERVDKLLETGLITQKSGIFLELKPGTSIHDLINSRINPEEIKKELKKRCGVYLSQEERLLLGFLLGCKNVVLGKHRDQKSWSSVTSRTQRNYQAAYEATIVNFPYLKKLFSYLTNLSLEKIEKIVSSLEEKALLNQENDPRCGFPGYITSYRVPVKFDFDYDTTHLKLKAQKYIEFLAENIQKYSNQLIFLDYLTQLYDAQQCDFLVNASLIKGLLEFLNFAPPSKYLPIYAFEDNVIVLHPWVKEEIRREIFERKLKLIEPLKTITLQLTEGYQNNISYNFSEKTTKEGYFIVEIESPDPSVGIVSFVLTPWICAEDMRKIDSICEKSNTVNLFVFHPNYPQIKKILPEIGKYNLSIIRGNIAYLWVKRSDFISQAFFAELMKQFKVVKKEEKLEDELKELMERFPNLSEVRFAVSEAEKLLRDAIRPRFIIEFGQEWEEKLKQEFPKESKIWERRKQASKKEPKDLLDFALLGHLKNIIDHLSFLKDCFKNFKLVKVSLEIFLSKKVYHHGRPEADLSDEEVEVVRTAYRNIKQLIK